MPTTTHLTKHQTRMIVHPHCLCSHLKLVRRNQSQGNDEDEAPKGGLMPFRCQLPYTNEQWVNVVALTGKLPASFYALVIIFGLNKFRRVRIVSHLCMIECCLIKFVYLNQPVILDLNSWSHF